MGFPQIVRPTGHSRVYKVADKNLRQGDSQAVALRLLTTPKEIARAEIIL